MGKCEGKSSCTVRMARQAIPCGVDNDVDPVNNYEQVTYECIDETLSGKLIYYTSSEK